MRPREVEERLNKSFHTCFSSAAGMEVLAHLRSITIEAVAGPNITADELRHREGMRFLVALIETRKSAAERDSNVS